MIPGLNLGPMVLGHFQGLQVFARKSCWVPCGVSIVFGGNTENFLNPCPKAACIVYTGALNRALKGLPYHNFGVYTYYVP